MKTTYTVEIDHSSKLPDNLKGAMEARIYDFISARGGDVIDVTAKIVKPGSTTEAEKGN